jgi:ribonuclease HII
VVEPTTQLETELLGRTGGPLAALDEVGRGAVAGPVTVGAVLVTREGLDGAPPVRDSKLLSAAAREALWPQVQRWAGGCAVGHASAAEIDRVGIVAALQLAACRALDTLARDAAPGTPALVLLDGDMDWLSPVPSPEVAALLGRLPGRPGVDVPVVTRVKADRDCVTVAAASIAAKVARDRVLTELAAELPGYGFERHKGYLTAGHTDALRRLGPSVAHRRSWRLPVPDGAASAA